MAEKTLNFMSFTQNFVDREKIPDICKSKLGSELGDLNQRLEIETVKAIYYILSHSKGKVSKDTWSVTLKLLSGNEVSLCGDLKDWFVHSRKDMYSYVAAILNAHTNSERQDNQEFLRQWQSMLKHLRLLVGNTLHFSEKQLSDAIVSSNFRKSILKVCAALYAYAISQFAVDNSSVNLIYEGLSRNPSYDGSFEKTVLQYQLKKLSQSPTADKLAHDILQGTTSLLIGSTGTGKTESVKKAALAVGAELIKIAGHPGVDDRQLFGSTHPSSKGGFEFIEGPLPEAWRRSLDRPVVLLIDELARMQPEYHAVLIGALDRLSGKEVKARKRFMESTSIEIEDNELYYALVLPNGQVWIAPAKNLSIICTTNLGCDYSQATTELDAALLSRFQTIIELEQMPHDTLVNILWSDEQVPLSVASLMSQISQYTGDNISANGGLLARESNIRVLKNWAKEALSLVQHKEISWHESLIQSCEVTLIPFVCSRLSNGTLDPTAKNMLLEELNSAIGKARL